MDIKCPNCGSGDLEPDYPHAYFTCNKCSCRFSKLQAATGKAPTQEERIKMIEATRDRLKILGCPVSNLNVWIEKQKRFLQKKNS